MSWRLYALCAMLFIILGGASVVIAQDYRYAMFDIGTLGGDETFATSLNDSGQVTGSSKVTESIRHPFIWEEGVLRDIDPSAPCCSNDAFGINNLGEVVGRRVGVDSSAVIWLPDGNRIELGTLGGRFTYPKDINDSRQVVGGSNYKPIGYLNPFLWEDGQMINLGTFGGEKGEASAINNRGQVVGTAWPPDGETKPFLWDSGQLIQLPILGGENGWAFDLNEDELIVGWATLRYSWEGRAVKWINREIFDIHDATVAEWSSASAVNNHGVIIGNMTPRGTQQSAAFIIIDDRMVDLNTLAPPRRQRQIERAADINDAGVIVGDLRGDPVRGYVLAPVTPTMALEAPFPGLAGRRNTLRVIDVTPGATVHFVYGTYGGGTIIPGCSIQTNALQIERPTLIGTAIADQSGVASITRTVPPIARGQTILFQAVVQNECAISQLVVHRFE